ncbi:class I SAM-dependent DNA methyltransferase [Desulfovermiculus halophilus]|jgi:predicted TPR repeat methyltransferase|uniref:class I SAM-dependent DNA methyltransferase n=1 Tax=Desulfovermiculus halophilus TaxID=339722 RepID=UPI0004825FF5|nr:class I SAM-dependent methyltransferase [Desulfovermiculus halophilus]
MSVDKAVLDKVYNATDHEELMHAYRDWAPDYDQNTVQDFGYVGYRICAELFARHLGGDTSLHILDAGCGTGLVGQELYSLGYINVEGLDYSDEMLYEAGRKGVYTRRINADLSQPLDMTDNTYDGVVCAGTFTYAHVTAEAFSELIRITKPGGIICFTIREGSYEDYGYREEMVRLEHDGAWELLEMRDEEYYKDKVWAKMCVYKVRA